MPKHTSLYYFFLSTDEIYTGLSHLGGAGGRSFIWISFPFQLPFCFLLSTARSLKQHTYRLPVLHFQLCLPASMDALLTPMSLLRVIKDHLINHHWAFVSSISRALDSVDHPLLKFHIQNHLIIPLPRFCQLYLFPKSFRKEILNSGLAQLPSLPSPTLVLILVANMKNSLKLELFRKVLSGYRRVRGHLIYPKGRMQLESRKDRMVRSGANEVSPLSLSSLLSGFLMICTDIPKVSPNPASHQVL